MKKNRIIIISIFFCCIIFTSIFNQKQIVNKSNVYLSKADFLEKMVEPVIKDMEETGVLASVTLGQAVVESGWGKDEIAVIYKNYFGMKNFAPVTLGENSNATCNAENYKMIGKASISNTYWDGTSVCLTTSEGGYAWFRVYSSVENSIKDHSRNLWCISDGRYIKNGLFERIDSKGQISVISLSGYATEEYGDYIYDEIISPNDFMKYDATFRKIKPAYAETCTDAVYEGVPVSIDNNNGTDVFKTTYDGNIKEGYIYKTQAKSAIKDYHGTMVESEIDNRINNIVDNIFGKAGKYEEKHGSDAYNPDLTYLEGSFKYKVPYYNQGDYSNSYGGLQGATIKSHGCGPTSMAMVISAFKGITLDPIQSTDWACSNGYCTSSGSSHALICAQAREYGLDCELIAEPVANDDSYQHIVDSLSSGNSLVVVLARNGIFTSGGHFLVLRGVDNDGKISVSDPASREKTAQTFSMNELIDPTKGHIIKYWIISEA